MRISRSLAYEHDLILVEVTIRGPRGSARPNLVLDTGAASTTILPEVLDEIGYSPRDGNKLTRVHSAIGEEHGYTLRVAEFSVLGVTTSNLVVNVFDLDHEGFDGLLGMNFLRHFNFEVRPADQEIVIELISGDWQAVVDD